MPATRPLTLEAENRQSEERPRKRVLPAAQTFADSPGLRGDSSSPQHDSVLRQASTGVKQCATRRATAPQHRDAGQHKHHPRHPPPFRIRQTTPRPNHAPALDLAQPNILRARQLPLALPLDVQRPLRLIQLQFRYGTRMGAPRANAPVH
jgi:hypothetical protein